MKNILLINPYSAVISGVNRATIESPLGLAYIASLLESYGHRCQIIDAQILGIPPERIIHNLAFTPDIIGISANIVTYPAALKTAENLRSSLKEIPIVFGGPHPSSIPNRTLEKSYINTVVIGEGEMAMLEMINNLEKKENIFSKVDGIAYKENGKIVFNKPRKLIEDLDILPFPAYHLLPDLRAYKSRARKSPVGQILTNRGCPYQCIFCNKNIFQHQIRLRTPENIIKEIDWLIRNYRIRQLDILDDNFNFNLNHAKCIMELLIARKYDLAINMQNGLRADNIDLEFLDLMKRAGVFKIGFGIESADPAIQARIKKILDLDKVIFITREAQRRNIIVYANFILGLPGDTGESMQRTIDFAVKMAPDIANFMVALPLPGTELYEEVKIQGRFLISVEDGVEKGFYAHQVFYEVGATCADKVLECYRKAYQKFYFRISWVLHSLKSFRSLNELLWFKDAVLDLTKYIFK